MRPLLLSLLLVLGAGCAPDRPLPADETADANADEAAEDPQAAWWTRMQAHCGEAFAGRLHTAPEGDAMLEGPERLVVHFRQCGSDTLRVPFHIERMDGTWDRSRTWVFIRSADGIELRHDHRHEDGTEDETTWYGGHTVEAGSAERQVFLYAEPAPDGSPRGWRVIVEPGERYVYGTYRGDDWRWRVDFDLSERVEVPPAPWGHERTPAHGAE